MSLKMAARTNFAPLTFGAARNSRVLFLAVFGIPLVIGIVAAVRNPNVVAGLPVAVLLWLAPQIWFARLRLVISAETVEYRTLFQKRSIALDDVVEAKISVGFSTESKHGFGPVHVVLSSGEPDAEPLRINAKVFSQSALQAVLDAVEQHGGRIVHVNRRQEVA